MFVILLISFGYCETSFFTDKNIQGTAKSRGLFAKQKNMLNAKNSKIVKIDENFLEANNLDIEIEGKKIRFQKEKTEKSHTKWKSENDPRSSMYLQDGHNGVVGSILVENKLYGLRRLDGDQYHFYEEKNDLECGVREVKK